MFFLPSFMPYQNYIFKYCFHQKKCIITAFHSCSLRLVELKKKEFETKYIYSILSK